MCPQITKKTTNQKKIRFFSAACHFRAKDLYRRPSLIFPPNFRGVRKNPGNNAAALLPPTTPLSCAGQLRAMPWQPSSRRAEKRKSTPASRVAWVCDTHERSAQKCAHVASVRARRGCPCAARSTHMMVQQPSKMAHAREKWSSIARQNRHGTIVSLTGGRLTLFAGPAQLATRV